MVLWDVSPGLVCEDDCIIVVWSNASTGGSRDVCTIEARGDVRTSAAGDDVCIGVALGDIFTGTARDCKAWGDICTSVA